MPELFIVAGLKAKQGKEEELRRDLVAVVEPSRTEDGNLRYELFVDQGDPGRFVFVEHWTSAEARHKHHTKGPHILNFHANGIANVERAEFPLILSRIA
jgi:quinol monooxygenase YgiN